MFTVVNLLRDYNTWPYIENGIKLKCFATKEKAFEYAVNAANEECYELNYDCDEDISFGIPEDDDYQNKEIVKVQYYDCYDNTEMVTYRYIYEIDMEEGD